uniref:Uncharacterized protein n=1 Tax=Panagrolaimus superbus TaxID=310955 RepID=A0A914Y939_9BILA
MAHKITLRSSIDPKFSIEVDDRVIQSCTILRNVQEHTNDDGEVDVDMTQRQLQNFVDLHNHFPSADAPKDLEWTNNFFREMPETEFKELCWKADYLDSQRFLEAAGDFVLNQMENFDVPEIQSYLNVVDDYTPEERRAMEEHPLEFFTGVSIQNDDNAPSTSGEPST